MKKVRDTCCRSLRIGGLLQSLEFALALHDVLVIPLDLDRLLEPPLEIPGRDLIVRSIPGFGGLETAFGLKTRLGSEQKVSGTFFAKMSNWKSDECARARGDDYERLELGRGD